MVKKKNNIINKYSNIFGLVGNILVVLLLIGILIFGYMAITGKIDINNLKNLFGDKFNINVPETEFQPAQDNKDCTDFHIANSYRTTYGNPIIDAFENACETNGGEWRELNNEMGCYWNPLLGNIDCNSPGVINFENYCENGLLANWVCDNNIAYAGCLCKKNVPDDWNQEEEQDDIPPNQDYEIGDVGTIFVTKLLWNGAIGGASGADMKCQVQAENAGFFGVWKAIICDDTVGAVDRILDTTYYRMDGNLVALNKADLFDGNIANKINIDEYGNVHFEINRVWSGCNRFGQPMPNGHCNNWGWVNALGEVGKLTETNGDWLDADTQDCAISARLYCVRTN